MLQALGRRASARPCGALLTRALRGVEPADGEPAAAAAGEVSLTPVSV